MKILHYNVLTIEIVLELLNNQYRDQLSGRGYNGMPAEATRALGRDYDNRKVSETY